MKSKSFLLHNGMLLANCNDDIKSYVYTEQCRRTSLFMPFPGLENSSNLKPPGCSCCDNCASKCQCYPGCLRSDFKLIKEGNHKEAEKYEKHRSATKEQVFQLKEELEQ